MSKNYLLGMHGGNGTQIAPFLDMLRVREMGAPLVFTFAQTYGENSIDLSHTPSGCFNIARLNYSYGDGTIPDPPWDSFAVWVGDFVANSQRVDAIIIGNEWNKEDEIPPGGMHPVRYAECYVQCYRTAKAANPDIKVLFAGTAPYNAHLKYATNPDGDWVLTMEDGIQAVFDLNIVPDGYVIHTYTHGHDSRLVYDPVKMDPPFDEHYYNFLEYTRYMEMLPPGNVYITETDQTEPWLDEANGWVTTAVDEVVAWNSEHPDHLIRALVLYRWPVIDQWFIEGKEELIWEIGQLLDEGITYPKENPVAEVLYNEDFAGPYPEYGGETPLKVIEGGVPWFVEHNPEDPDWKYKRPEYGPYTDFYVSEPTCQKIHHNFATWRGGILWTIPVLPSSQVTVSISGYLRSGSTDSNEKGNGWWQLGIAEGIGLDAPPESTAWSPIVEYIYDEWRELQVQTTVESDYITVFVECDWEYPVGWNDLYLDDLLVLGEGTPPTPSGDWEVVVFNPEGVKVVSVPFAVASPNARIVELAQQIIEEAS